MTKNSNAVQSKPDFEDYYRTVEEKIAVLEKGGIDFSDTMTAYTEAAEGLIGCLEFLKEAKLTFECYEEKIGNLLKECDE